MKVLTTGDVAKICQVAPRTVTKWFDTGGLKGYRIPGSRERRIPQDQLVKFMKRHGMPLGDLEDSALGKALIVTQDQLLFDNLQRHLAGNGSLKAAIAASGFEAGMQSETFHPDAVIVDFSIGCHEALQICQNLRRSGEHAEKIIMAVLPHGDVPATFDRSSITETFHKPFDAALLAARLRTLIGAKKELA